MIKKTILNFSSSELQRLFDNTISVFGNVRGTKTIALFGSSAERKDDEYSDLDLEVQTANYGYISRNFEHIISKIGRPYIIFPVANCIEEGVFTVLWKDYSFYQKLDIRIFGLHKNLSKNSLIVLKTSGSGYKALNSAGRDIINVLFNEEYRPFYDFYIGATRYVKHSLRAQVASMSKFYKSSWESYVKLKEVVLLSICMLRTKPRWTEIF